MSTSLTDGTVWLMNSAMMPVPGRYELFRITPEEFAACIRQVGAAGSLVSCIGYEHNAHLIEELAGVRVEVSRRETVLKDGDMMLIMRLRRRLTDPRQKGRFQPALEEFEFFRAYYNNPAVREA